MSEELEKQLRVLKTHNEDQEKEIVRLTRENKVLNEELEGCIGTKLFWYDQAKSNLKETKTLRENFDSAMKILENVRNWQACPEEYEKEINKLMKVNK